MPSNSSAAPVRNGNCPMIGDETIAGSTNTATAHQPRRSSGKAQKVAAITARVTTTSMSVTVQSPNTGRSSAPTDQGRNP